MLMQKVEDVMTRTVVTVSSSATAVEAAQLMKKKRIGCLVVVKSEIPVGIITERDLAYRVIAEGRSANVSVGEVMTKEVKTIEKQATVNDAAKLMAAHIIRRLPVVENKKLVGIVTIDDMIRSERAVGSSQSYSYS